ncbi:MAG: DUF1573 domain-containing protein [Patescibacteria group bacterium]
MNQDTKIVATIFILIIVIGGVIFLSSKGQVKKPEQVVLNPEAKLEISKKVADLGNMKVSDEKSADFEIKNNGSSTLKIFNVFTSCDCTFARVLINGKESPEFNMAMHMPPDALRWAGEILPNATATIRAIYKPAVMPVFGLVERNIMFSTNDPSNKQVELTIKASVSK